MSDELLQLTQDSGGLLDLPFDEVLEVDSEVLLELVYIWKGQSETLYNIDALQGQVPLTHDTDVSALV